jgi:uncharacterized DUF497 family protein
MVLIQWNAGKSESNFEKHGVLFEEAASVFFDRNKVEFFDNLPSQIEDSFWVIGRSDKGQLLFVVYSWRKSRVEKKEYYRIISARIAKKAERRLFDERS